MSEKQIEKLKNVPKLRFPEFRDAGEWEEKKMGDICDVRDGTHDSPQFYNTGKPLVTSKNLLSSGLLDLENVSYISQEDYEKINKRSKVDIGDILFGMIGTIGNPVMVKLQGFAIKNVALIKQKTDLLNCYLVQFLNSQYIATRFNTLNTGNTQKFIALGQIRNLAFPVPSVKEQQKIADCLASLDDRLAAETQTIDTLKAHKKGLMQQLFPAEGETLPKLRFPEFRDAGEWKIKKLGEVCDCIVPGRDKPKSFTGDIPWVTIPDIQGLRINSSVNKLGLSTNEIKECGAKIVPKDSVIMSCVGTFGLVSICDQDLVINQQLHAWIPSPKINNYYLAYCLILQKEQMERMATNTTIAYLNKSTCNTITIWYSPMSRQQKSKFKK